MKLALFFTCGISLKTWVDTGLFDREKLIYEEHLNRGHLSRVFWFTYGSGDREIAQKLQFEKRLHPAIHVVPMPKVFDFKRGSLVYSFLVPFLHRKVFRRSDVLKTNQIHGSWTAVLAKCLYHKPLIVRTGYTLSLFAKRLKKSESRIVIYRMMERLAYKNATCAIVTSKKDEIYILNAYRCPAGKIVIIPNYVDADLFKPHKNEKYTNRIIFVGRLNKEKNLFNLISAIAKTDLILDIYGKGELREALEQHAKSEGARVNFMGTVPNNELPDILNRYKYYILPSYFEGMPKTLLEAMACGLVCIGTDVEGVNEVIEDGVNGVLAQGTDVVSLTKAIQNIERNSQLKSRLGHGARQSILSKFSIESVLAQEWILCQLFR